MDKAVVPLEEHSPPLDAGLAVHAGKFHQSTLACVLVNGDFESVQFRLIQIEYEFRIPIFRAYAQSQALGLCGISE